MNTRKPYTLSRNGYIFSTYNISYKDTVIFTGLSRHEAFNITGALNNAFLEGVKCGSDNKTEGS